MENSKQYIPFARKYRPSNFSELDAQDAFTKILTFTILNSRLSHAYLLTGIRGVGKTTAARIIAKTINCTSLIKVDSEENKSVNPCNKCQNCISSNDYKHPDIIEIDAASKTSVDDVRSIIESSEYRPLLGQYKIFIIDEVHMLSKSAFNALLKIIEEPPEHIIFIFATTEVQKMPLTVVSRCQRHDLKRFSFNQILNLLKKIVLSENLDIEGEALRIIANKSEGSARDAVTLLDQSTSLGKSLTSKITADMINSMLGLVETSLIIEFSEHLINKNTNSAIELINKVYISSHNLEGFVQSVCEFIAYLSKLKVAKTYTNPVYESHHQSILKIVKSITIFELSLLWQIFSKGMIEIKTSYNQLITVEMLAIKAIHSISLSSIEEFLDNNPRQLA